MAPRSDAVDSEGHGFCLFFCLFVASSVVEFIWKAVERNESVQGCHFMKNSAPLAANLNFYYFLIFYPCLNGTAWVETGQDGRLHFWELVEATPLSGAQQGHAAAVLCVAFFEETLVTWATWGLETRTFRAPPKGD